MAPEITAMTTSRTNGSRRLRATASTTPMIANVNAA
jgi:hypothetical protein